MNDVKLPETVEEFQERLRLAFVSGAEWRGRNWAHQSLDASTAVAEEAKRRFPIVRKVHRVISATDSQGSTWYVRVEDGEFMAARHPSGPFMHQYDTLTPQNVRAFADILDRPCDEVVE